MRDTAWFDQLFSEHAPSIHRYLQRRIGRQDSDDLTADVFTLAWKKRDEIPEGFEVPWLYRSAHYLVANHYRKKNPSLPGELPEGSADDVAPFVCDQAEISSLLASLSARDRRILLLVAWEGLSGDELAVALGVSRGASDTALSRARSRLQSAWDSSDQM